MSDTQTIGNTLSRILDLDDRPSDAYRHWGRNILFTEAAKRRLSSILGFIAGAACNDQLEFAEKLADDFERTMSRLQAGCEDVELNVVDSKGETHKAHVPGQRIILSADGMDSRNSFSIVWLRPVSPEKYYERYQEKLNGASDPDAVTQAGLIVELNDYFGVVPSVEEQAVTVAARPDSWVESWSHEEPFPLVRYKSVIFGGLIYFGPSPGPNFTSRLDSRQSFWSCHT